MNSELLSELLLGLLNYYERVSLPGLGSFIKRVIPAHLSADGTLISPPIVKIEFKTSEIWDDELLIKKYSQHEHISYTIAKEEVIEQMNKLSDSLIKSKNILLPGLGTFSYNQPNVISFTPSPGVEYSLDSFGLEPVNIKPLNIKGQIEQIVEKHQKHHRKPKRWHRAILFLIYLVIILCVAAALIYLFREELRPLLEKILYNKEERELLQLIKY